MVDKDWWKTCDLYDMLGSSETFMSEQEKQEYREWLRDNAVSSDSIMED